MGTRGEEISSELSIMASLSWISHVETFVNPDKSAHEQATSLDALASLVLGDQLTLQLVVAEMEAYLTTTDNAIRARGILLLAEILTRLKTKPLEDTSIHSLTSFFTSRLADWQALRGAVIGCLALLKRSSDVGLVSASDARKLAESYLENLQIQALAQQDRMLCFELLICLLDVYADAVSPLGDDLVFGVCAAIDEEGDPRCLFLAFHIMESLVQLFPDADGPVASCTEDLFDIISRYFPIIYTPPPNTSLGITREDLSRALMECFMSSSLFAPFSIPLLLEKLSSSLQIAKVDALKYLGKCAMAYGVDAMSSQSSAIWAALKNVIFNSMGPVSEATRSMSLRENEVLEAALTCLTECILAYHRGNDTGAFLQLVLQDEHLEDVFRSVTSDVSAKRTPTEKLRFEVQLLGCLLSASAKASHSCCSAVSQKFLPSLLDAMGGPLEGGPNLTWDLNGSSIHNFSVNFSALSLCLEILEANRVLAEHLALESDFSVEHDAENSWLSLLRRLSCPLTVVFASAIQTHNGTDFQEMLPSTRNEIICLAVTGLQTLAVFPGRFSPFTEDQYKHVLLFLVSFILKRHNDVFLWEQVLGALVKISVSLEKFNDSKKALCFQHIVIEELFCQLFTDERPLPISLNLKAIIATCNSSFAAMTQVLQIFQRVLCTNFLQACVKPDGENAMKLVVNILDCLSSSVLPCCIKMNTSEEAIVQLALAIWTCVEEITTFDVHPPGQLLEATMAVMRVSVQWCTEELQKMVLLKALDILSPQLSSLFGTSEAMNCPAQQDNFNTDGNSIDRSNQEQWKVALFSSVVVSLRPKVVLHYERPILKMFMNAILGQGDNLVKDAAAQALASMINKWPVAVNTDETSNILTLEDAIYTVLRETSLRIAGKHGPQSQSEMVDSGTCSLRFHELNAKYAIGVQIQAITTVAWIGKGLAMRGHNKISDVAVLLLNALRSSGTLHLKSSEENALTPEVDMTMELKSHIAQAAADGLGIIMKDSRTSLNKDCHAVIRPLYKQRFFNSMIPILILAIKEAGASFSRIMFYRALGLLVSNAPHVALMAESKKLLPFILDGILVLISDAMNKELVQSLMLALSGILVDENNGRALVVEHISTIVNCLVEVISYPYSMTVREAALQCLGTMIELPYPRIFPVRTQVLKAVSKALDDQKRSVRKEAVRCHHAWASIASRTSIY